MVVGPRVEGDSLTGRAANDPARIAMPVADVQRVEARGFSAGRTALAAGVYLGLMLLISDR